MINKFGFLALAVISLAFIANGYAQDTDGIELRYVKQDSGVKASMRGLSVVSPKVVWASGANATILRTTDGGTQWQKLTFPGNQKVDFRDVHGFDKDNAVVMTAGQPAQFWRTNDGGKTWKQVFEDKREASFYDSIVFFGDKLTGVGFSDPIDGHLQIVRTTDGGKSWSFVEKQKGTKVPEGTGGFAASGTCLCAIGKNSIAIALGGKICKEGSKSQILISNDSGKTWEYRECPIPADKAAGVFSIASDGKKRCVVVGGDYVDWKASARVAAVSDDQGKTWKIVENGPRGFRSAVDACWLKLDSGKSTCLWLAAGTNGFDWSFRPTEKWNPSKIENMHTVQFVPVAKWAGNSGSLMQTAWSTGPEGKIYKIEIRKGNKMD